MSKIAEKMMRDRRAWFTSGRMFGYVCPRCLATGVNMADKCSARLDDPCPGFQAIEAAHKEFAENYNAIVGIPV
ncbi:MAG: hypothetical protein NW215_10650 [Hyphomicrobiales bacterium]|nr:hypothetical protein [Hyphomicrobiales bacterium]